MKKLFFIMAMSVCAFMAQAQTTLPVFAWG